MVFSVLNHNLLLLASFVIICIAYNAYAVLVVKNFCGPTEGWRYLIVHGRVSDIFPDWALIWQIIFSACHQMSVVNGNAGIVHLHWNYGLIANLLQWFHRRILRLPEMLRYSHTSIWSWLHIRLSLDGAVHKTSTHFSSTKLPMTLSEHLIRVLVTWWASRSIWSHL